MKKEKIKPTYKYMVLNKESKWESWTGIFDDLVSAERWFKNHGQFHIDNGHILGLFINNKLIRKIT